MTTKALDKPANGRAESVTPEQVTKAINKLLEQYGYGLSVVIVDQRSGLNVTDSMREQWGYVPVAQVVKR